MKSVLITGNKGFIGGKLESYLSERDYKVRGIDISSGQDIRNLRIQDNVYDAIIHLAGVTDIQIAERYTEDATDVNVMGTFNLLREARKKNVKRFIFMSSAAVYGFEHEDTMPISIRESFPTNPNSVYGRNKLIGEQLCKLYFDRYGLETITLRLFNVYGEGQEKGLIGHIREAIKSDVELLMYRDGQNTRDYIHIDDVVEAIVSSLNTKSEICFGNEFNIGTGKDYSVLDVIDEVRKYKELKVRPTKEIKERKYSRADNTKAREHLGWRPTIELKEGLVKLL